MNSSLSMKKVYFRSFSPMMVFLLPACTLNSVVPLSTMGTARTHFPHWWYLLPLPALFLSCAFPSLCACRFLLRFFASCASSPSSACRPLPLLRLFRFFALLRFPLRPLLRFFVLLRPPALPSSVFQRFFLFLRQGAAGHQEVRAEGRDANQQQLLLLVPLAPAYAAASMIIRPLSRFDEASLQGLGCSLEGRRNCQNGRWQREVPPPCTASRRRSLSCSAVQLGHDETAGHVVCSKIALLRVDRSSPVFSHPLQGHTLRDAEIARDDRQAVAVGIVLIILVADRAALTFRHQAALPADVTMLRLPKLLLLEGELTAPRITGQASSQGLL